MGKKRKTKNTEYVHWTDEMLRREELRMYRIRRLCRTRGTELPTRPMPYVCECCRRPRGATSRGMAYDHCHRTKKFRGWLCGSCNMGLGLLGDTYMSVKKMLGYLERSRR